MSALVAEMNAMNLSASTAEADDKKQMSDLLRSTFFEGFDFSKMNSPALIISLQEDALLCEAQGRPIEPSDKSFELAGLTKEQFLLLSEKAAQNLNQHSPKGKKNRKQLQDICTKSGLGGIKDHMLALTKELNRSEISKLSQEWNIELAHFKCLACNVQQKDCAQKLLRCGGCGEVFYCSKECQKTHWKSGHKASCSRSILGTKKE
jgi:MYND finger